MSPTCCRAGCSAPSSSGAGSRRRFSPVPSKTRERSLRSWCRGTRAVRTCPACWGSRRPRTSPTASSTCSARSLTSSTALSASRSRRRKRRASGRCRYPNQPRHPPCPPKEVQMSSTMSASPADSVDVRAGGANGTGTAWHNLPVEEVAAELGVDPKTGLDPAEVERRRGVVGPNKLAEGEKEPGWKAFLRQYRDLMQLVLLGAAIVSMAALQEFSTGIVIIGLTVLNAILGLNQEGKAAASVAALQKMLVIRAEARRGGHGD